MTQIKINQLKSMNSNKLLRKLLFTVLLAMTITGCASGPRYSAMHNSEAPIAAGDGRIYIYRTTVGGAAVQPEVKVDDQVVGQAVPKGYFFIDRPAGNYQISTSTEVKRTLSLTLDPAQERYVRLNISIGFFVGHVWPELIDNQVAEKEIQNCHFVGK
jgi:hypothetical protein